MKSLTMIRSIAALLILCHQVLTYNLSYSALENILDIQEKRESVHPFDSCALPRRDDEDHLWGNYICECGIHCIRRSTCCIDSPYAGRSRTVYYRGESCQKPPGFAENVELISRCRHQVSGSAQVREECERINQYEDPLRMTPATSLVTNRTYKNYFCAVCNRDARDIVLWKIHLAFPSKDNISQVSNVTEEYFREDLVFSDEHKSWGVMKGNSFYRVNMSFTVPPELQKIVKRCYPGMVSECQEDYENYEFRYMCESYYTPLKKTLLPKSCDGYWGKPVVYRNKHCERCNRIPAFPHPICYV